MRAYWVAAALLASTIFSTAALSAAPPDGASFAGYITPNTVNPARDGIWCMTDTASSTFVSRQSPVATLISFSEVIYTASGSVGPTAYRLSGQARLIFAAGSTTHGKVSFDANSSYPATVYRPNFNGFAQNYNASTHTLVVHLNIVFPGCTLPISAVYRN